VSLRGLANLAWQAVTICASTRANPPLPNARISRISPHSRSCSYPTGQPMYISSLQDSKLQVRKRYLLGRAVQLTDGGPETEGGVTCVGLLCSIGEERPMWPARSTRTYVSNLEI
jgi:hypothetical protein